MSEINSKQFQQLKKSYAKKSLAQTYLFSGPEGVGKLDAVLDFLLMINGKGDREKILEGADPDFIIVKPEIQEKNSKKRKKDISVGQVKEAIAKVKYYPYEAKYKFLIILEAEKLNRTAANSLLKLIEEPVSDMMIILVTNKEQRILPTIRSRCQQKRFGLASDEDLREELGNLYPKTKQDSLDLAVELARGRIGFAKTYIENPELAQEIQQQIEDFRETLRGGVVKGFQLSEKNSADKEKALAAIGEWIWYLRGFLRKCIDKGDNKKVIVKIFVILNSLFDLRNVIETTNANQRVQLDNFFVQIN